MSLDVVVSGAGIVGLAAAQTFASHGYRTLLVDPDQTPDTVGVFGVDLRTVALSPVAIDQLAELAIELPSTSGFIDAMHVWESDGSAAITMKADEVQEPHLATVYENQVVTDALKARCPKSLEMKFRASVTAIDAATRTLDIDGIGPVKTNLLVIAEGANSSTRKLLDVGLDIDEDLQQHAIATIIKFDAAHTNMAWQVFGPTPLALLPLPQADLMALIWSLPSDVASETMALSDSEFILRLNLACEDVIGTATAVDRRVSFPLRQQLVSDFNPSPWILIVGDAAHTLHPLAGQGVNLGLEDVRAVDKVLHNQPSRLNKPNLWRPFNAKRKLRAAGMVQLMSLFTNVYSLKSPYMRLFRNIGVRWVNANEGLKRQLILEAMGIGPIASVS